MGVRTYRCFTPPSSLFFAPRKMRSRNMHYTLNYSLHLLLFSFFIFTASSQNLLDPCSLITCNQGTCVSNTSSILEFDCDCFPGWKKLQIGPLTFPSCVVPNCTVNFQCGNGAPPPPPPPPPLINISSPCNHVWCGDGNCIVNGTEHYCQCDDGSTNLMNNPVFACFKQCYFGADCDSLGYGSKSPPSKSDSPGNGPNYAQANCSRNLRALTIIVLSAMFLTWI